jgi:hypothetical protein
MTHEPVAAPPPKRAASWRRPARRVAIVLGAALTCVALLCCAGVGYVAYNANRAPHEERAMEAFANDVCRDLLRGDADAVYAALSADARDRYSAQGFAHDLLARGRLTRCDVVRATYLLLLAAYVLIEDDHGQHTFDLAHEAGRWKVDSDILHDLDSPAQHGGGGGFDD